MLSKWFQYKASAVAFRRKGDSIREIEKELKIPRSTLSRWFKDIRLTKAQTKKLAADNKNGLIAARKKAVIWHRAQKAKRLVEASQQALGVLSKIQTKDNNVLELALAMLYLGEGDKTNQTSMGNTNPIILKFFISSLVKVYQIKKANIKCQLHLRTDQDKNEMIKYWAKELKIPRSRFSSTADKRISRSKTYPDYKGVCVVRCGNIALQRRLMFLSQQFCNIISTQSDT